jgi:hypothetical protein
MHAVESGKVLPRRCLGKNSANFDSIA